MKIKKALVASCLVIGSMVAATQALAEAFIGGSIGQGDIGDEITTGLIDGNQTIDGKDTAWKIFGGYMFNRHFGLEAAYVNLGELSYSGTFQGAAVTGGKVELSGINIAALGAYPVTEQFSVFGKIGLFLWDAEASDTTAGLGAFSAKEDGTDVSFGVGVGYNFTRNLGVRAEWEMFKADEADASLISIGLVWRF